MRTKNSERIWLLLLCLLLKRVSSFSPPSSSNPALRYQQTTIRYPSAASPLASRRTVAARKSCVLLHDARSEAIDVDFSTVDEDASSNAAAQQEEAVNGAAATAKKRRSLSKRIKCYFSPPDDGLTFRQRLGKLGLSCALSYGFVSNVNGSLTMSIAWYTFCKKFGTSPLAPGQWARFSALYAGFYLFNSIIRPLRFSIAVALGPKFDQVVASVQKRLNVSKAMATGITVFVANFLGSAVMMCGGVSLASALTGVPVFVRRP